MKLRKAGSVSTTSFQLAGRKILLIAYMTGILWLRRNPISLLFSAISPFSILFVLFVVSNGQYLQFAVSGSLVMALVGYGLALGQDISFYKTEYKIQDVFVASPVSSLTYMTGLALSQILLVFSHASHEKCYPNNLICKCNFGCIAPCLLFDRTTTN